MPISLCIRGEDTLSSPSFILICLGFFHIKRVLQYYGNLIVVSSSIATTLSSSAGPVNYTSVECEDEPWRDRFLQVCYFIILCYNYYVSVNCSHNTIGGFKLCCSPTLIDPRIYDIV